MYGFLGKLFRSEWRFDEKNIGNEEYNECTNEDLQDNNKSKKQSFFNGVSSKKEKVIEEKP